MVLKIWNYNISVFGVCYHFNYFVLQYATWLENYLNGLLVVELSNIFFFDG